MRVRPLHYAVMVVEGADSSLRIGKQSELYEAIARHFKGAQGFKYFVCR